jgi:hypothetical protein
MALKRVLVRFHATCLHNENKYLNANPEKLNYSFWLQNCTKV